MKVIHFTSRAADPLKSFAASGAALAVTFLPLASGQGDMQISRLHLEMDGKLKPVHHPRRVNVAL